jgi:hypothetical protein
MHTNQNGFRPQVIYSRHTNLQERLLWDLKRKLLWGVFDTDMGKRPCYCLTKFKVNGECVCGGDESCRTSGTVYKILSKYENYNCFYISKSQHYIKTCVQEHIGEVTKLYAKNILKLTAPQNPPHPTHHRQNSQCALTPSPSRRNRPHQVLDPTKTHHRYV